ncbi:SDR family oxidoreductase [Mesorhizobium sp. ESP6-5]|uniref:SDR family NAD(P)-dependent oxidoreductase n=1 Tax=unclassified Mesorhizobium TaxID=325217 RepID=UPI0015E295E3|nr:MULTISPECIES: SDR family oxidoreductase [unclassified Mesorhizobium]MBZ9758309.1 SDR family oxidoreductase [Mesorhizobium sp. ESP6-5]
MTNSTGSSLGVAVITGASSGIGKAFAERLASDGYDIVLVARRRDRLESVAREIKAGGAYAEIIVADLALSEGIDTVEQRIRAGDVSLLVNNAGFQTYMPFVELSIDRAQEEVAVQVTAVMRLSHAALPAMIARGEGAIINVSSLLSFSGSMNSPFMPKRSVYAATKAFVTTFSELLAAELQGKGILVQALCPAVVRTEFHDIDGKPVLRPNVPVMEPADVVKASLAGLRQGDTVCIPALEQKGKFSAVADANRVLFDAGRGAELASRYR